MLFETSKNLEPRVPPGLLKLRLLNALRKLTPRVRLYRRSEFDDIAPGPPPPKSGPLGPPPPRGPPPPPGPPCPPPAEVALLVLGPKPKVLVRRRFITK